MAAALLSFEGLFDSRGALAVEDALHFVVVDGDGRLLVAMIDVLSMARLRADADLLDVTFVDGTSRVLTVLESLEPGEVFAELDMLSETRSDHPWSVRLWSAGSRLPSPVSSIQAITFASFVGLT